MLVVKFTDVPRTEWTSLVESSPDTWLFHRPEWIDLENRFFTAANLSFGITGGHGELLAICPLYLRKLGRGEWVERLLDSGHHRHSGAAFRPELEPQVLKGVRRTLMRHVFEVADEHDVDRVFLNSNNLAPANCLDRTVEIPFWMKEYGFQSGSHVGPNGDFPLPGMATLFVDQIIDLQRSEDELFEAMDPNFRKAVRKAVKAGLTIVEPPKDAMEEYYCLARISARRTGEALAPKEYYHSIWDAFSSCGKCHMLLAHHEGRAAGAIFILADKRGAQYFTGVFHHDYLPMRVSNFLHWEVIRRAKALGMQRYRLGPTFPTVPTDWPVARVSRIKGDMGAASYTIIQGSYFRKLRKYIRDAVDNLAAQRDVESRIVA